jgi:hypothetical protein
VAILFVVACATPCHGPRHRAMILQIISAIVAGAPISGRFATRSVRGSRAARHARLAATATDETRPSLPRPSSMTTLREG